MKNLKRVLSLALSGIMLVGMMAIGASAADFTDAELIEHENAVNTLVALKIINGKPDGSFDPKGDVTRAEMAKMIAVAMNGGNDANTGVKAVPSFTDIKDTWAESYIEYCYDLGIISGRGDGTFDPTGKVTGLEATKMVLTALNYDSTAYQLIGATWAAKTDELARKAEPSLYVELETVNKSLPATRDMAAQLIWNGLQNETRQINPGTNTSSGETTWNYGTSGKTLLEERYNAKILTGTYQGNSKNLDIDDGFIMVAGYDFPSTMGIENIGEQVKVIFKDGSGSGARTGKPDKRDVIYGVFNTKKTDAYDVLTKDLADAEDAAKVKFDGSKYDVATVVTGTDSDGNVTTTAPKINVVTNLIGAGTLKDASYFNNDTDNGGIRETGLDRIKFVCNEDGQVVSAYITEVKVGKVTNVTSSKVTVSGLGTVVIADNDVYSGIAKDDVVTYTMIYSTKVSDAFITIEKVESIEGKVTGFKKTDGKVENIVVGGKTYKTMKGSLSGTNNVLDYKDANLTGNGDEVKLYVVNDLVVAAEAISEAGGNYALVIDQDGTTLQGVLSSMKMQVLLTDGTDEIVTVHKDSKKNGTDALTSSDVQPGDLIEYTSLTNGVLKIKKVLKGAENKTTVTATGDPAVAKIWDATSKKLADVAVATTTAPLFAKVGDDYYVYNLRSLGDVKNAANTDVYYVNDGGKIVVGYATLDKKPAGTTTDTLYGVVASHEGKFKAPNDSDMELYKVAVDGETINVYTDKVLAAGNLVTFDRAADDCYDTSDIKVITSGSDSWVAGALVGDDNGDLLVYLAKTEDDPAAKAPSFSGGDDGETTVALGKSVTIIYLNCEDKEPGNDVGYVPFDPAKGYANAMIHTDDGAVDIIIIETSGNANLDSPTCADAATTNFGTQADRTTTPSVPSED